MDIRMIKEAREEAVRFVTACDRLLREEGPAYNHPRESGIVRAQSLLLWRCLATMRRSG